MTPTLQVPYLRQRQISHSDANCLQLWKVRSVWLRSIPLGSGKWRVCGNSFRYAAPARVDVFETPRSISLLNFNFWSWLWFVDPDLLRHGQWLWRLADKTFGMSTLGGVENRTTAFDDLRSQAIMNHCRREKAQSGMAMLFVIPGEKLLGRGTGIL